MKVCAVLTTCLIAMISLTGCKVSGGSTSSSGDSTSVASLPYISDSGDGGSGSGNGTNPLNIAYNPEPATIALLGSGLFAYAFLRKKKK